MTLNKDQLLNLVYSKIEELTEGSTARDFLSPDTVILDSGLDSLGYAHVMLSLEEMSGKSVLEDGLDWSKIDTINKLVELFL